MRIYFYNNYLYGRGGMETVVPMVCRSLIQRGHEVKIILINKSEFLDWSVGIPVIYIESEIEQNQWQNVNTNDIYGCTLILQKIFKNYLILMSLYLWILIVLSQLGMLLKFMLIVPESLVGYTCL